MSIKNNNLETLHVLTYFMQKTPAHRAALGFRRFLCLRDSASFQDLPPRFIKHLRSALRHFQAAKNTRGMAYVYR